MARRNEIMEEAEKHMYDWGVDVDRFDVPDIFAKGAEWADEHPRSNMVDIEDVCEWMHNFQNSKGEYPLYDYVGNFRKAIENKLG